METISFQPSDKLCLELKLWQISGYQQMNIQGKPSQDDNASIATFDEGEMNYKYFVRIQ
jgi:hypothetical protein